MAIISSRSIVPGKDVINIIIGSLINLNVVNINLCNTIINKPKK